MADVFVIEINGEMTEEQEDTLNEFMSAWQDAYMASAQKLADQLQVPVELALDIMYLRERSRHRPETEERMLKCYRETGRTDFRCCAGEEEDALAEAGY